MCNRLFAFSITSLNLSGTINTFILTLVELDIECTNSMPQKSGSWWPETDHFSKEKE
jgi:hypothetical protein